MEAETAIRPWHVGYDDKLGEWYVLDPEGNRHVITRSYLAAGFDSWLQQTLDDNESARTRLLNDAGVWAAKAGLAEGKLNALTQERDEAKHDRDADYSNWQQAEAALDEERQRSEKMAEERHELRQIANRELQRAEAAEAERDAARTLALAAHGLRPADWGDEAELAKRAAIAEAWNEGAFQFLKRY